MISQPLIQKYQIYFQPYDNEEKAQYGKQLVINEHAQGTIRFESVFMFEQATDETDFELRFHCFKIDGSKKNRVWTITESIPRREDQLEFVYLQDKAAAEFTPGEYECELRIGGSRVGGFYFFSIVDSPFSIDVKLYEGPDPDYYEPGMEYRSAFDIENTRFICLECNVSSKTDQILDDYLHFQAINGKTKAVLGTTREHLFVSPDQPKATIRVGWGSEKPGFWPAGQYILQVLFKKKVILTEEFECYRQQRTERTEDFRSPVLDLKYLDVSPQTLTRFPDEIDEQLATILSYKSELDKIADYIRQGLSVLIMCDKILVEYLYDYICSKANKQILSDLSYDLNQMYTQLGNMNKDRVMVLRSIDLLDYPMGIFMLYHTLKGQSAQFLAFCDPNANLSPILTNRFAVKVSLLGLPKRIFTSSALNSQVEQGLDIFQYIVTRKERERFLDSGPEKDRDREFSTAIYKQVANLNVIQFRQAMKYIGTLFKEPVPYKKIFREINVFKSKLIGDDIEIPETTFEAIGGYSHVKSQIYRTLDYIANRNEQQQKSPKFKGFIFWGPPGTGKTLFAKAIANELNATIQMISGPEIVEKWVGQSEANMRRIFAVARRNAPSIILFDEFDSIAQKRSQAEDGGARVGNSLMAQLLTELDGFREDDGVLVVGTTNRIEAIDTALLRPSRLTPIEIGLPDIEARRHVAKIHAKELGIEEAACKVFNLAKQHLSQWKGADQPIPPIFLEELFSLDGNGSENQITAEESKIKRWFEGEKTKQKFSKELAEFTKVIYAIQDKFKNTESSLLEQINTKIIELGQRYGINLSPESLPDLNLDNNERLSGPQRDIRSLFQTIESLKSANGEISDKIYFNTLMDLIAEFTDGFNNDEIRAIFQEISMDAEGFGQIITPRYIGEKIGLLQKRRTEHKKK